MAFRLVRVAGLAAICLFSRFALAEPTPSEKETARGMMDEGHAKRDAGDHAAALAQFQGADAIMHVPTTALEVGREQVALGQLVEARDTLERLMRSAPTPGESDAFRAARKAADALDRELSTRIPSLRITPGGLASGATADVNVDGAAIPFAALIAPIKVNPGHHVVTATVTGSGAEPVRQEVDVAEGQTAPVVFTLSSGGAARPTPAIAQPEPTATSASSSDNSSTVDWLRWGGVGLAGVGVAVGAITGAMSLSSTSSATKGCQNDRCPPPTWGDIDSARTTATVSTVAFVAAGVGAAIAITGFVLPRHSTRTTETGTADEGVSITARVGPGSFSLAGTF
jgi:hypothetical protein